MKSTYTSPPGRDGKTPRPEVDQLEQWVAEQLALAPALSPAQLSRLQTLLAATPVVRAKSA